VSFSSTRISKSVLACHNSPMLSYIDNHRPHRSETKWSQTSRQVFAGQPCPTRQYLINNHLSQIGVGCEREIKAKQRKALCRMLYTTKVLPLRFGEKQTSVVVEFASHPLPMKGR